MTVVPEGQQPVRNLTRQYVLQRTRPKPPRTIYSRPEWKQLQPAEAALAFVAMIPEIQITTRSLTGALRTFVDGLRPIGFPFSSRLPRTAILL